MKKYKFKLEPLLKIRKLHEEKCKMEIGRLRVQITNLKNEIVKHREDIQEIYDFQEMALAEGISAQELSMHPYFVDGKKANIELLQREIRDLEEEVDEKFQELIQLRADVKVVEKMKEKDYTNFKKDIKKKEFNNIEELNQNWNQTLTKGIIKSRGK